MITLYQHGRPLPAAPVEARLREVAATIAGWAALLPLALLMRESPRAVLATIPGGRAQADLGFGLGRLSR